MIQRKIKKKLFDNLQNTNSNSSTLSWPLRLRILIDIANGMNYLHSLNPPIIHCDLRSPNVLLMSLKYDDEIVSKVADFGLAQYSIGRFLVNSKLNPAWSAPEVIESKDLSPQSDIYSFGTILFEILTGDIPYDLLINSNWKFRYNIEEDVKKGIKPPYSKEKIEKYHQIELPQEMINLLESCWDMKPWNRPSFELILNTLCPLLSSYWSKATELIPSKKKYNQITLHQIEEIKERERIQFKHEIGKGSFGTCYTCEVTGWKG